jgi:hypothetical protein
MLKKMIFGTVILLGFVFVFGQSEVYSQTLSKEEQKLMQNQIKDSLNSAKYIKRQADLEKLLSKPPKTCGLASIDGLASNSKVMILENQKINELLNTYVGQLISDDDGETTQQQGDKVSFEDIVQLSTSVANQLLAVTDATVKATAAAGDLTKVSPTKVGAAKKSLAYTNDALAGIGTQLKAQANILKQMKIYKEAIKNM